MALSWNEIKRRAVDFANEWAGEAREHAEAKTFWDGFFQVFGITHRRVATFEEPVRKLDSNLGFIDLFWKGTLIVEHKSRGRNLDKAYSQALSYFAGLKEYELPRYVLVSDFERFRFYDLDDDTECEFTLDSLPDHIHLFGFVAGYVKKEVRAEDPANFKAAELMANLHDRLLASGYGGVDLEVLLVRILFCLFADDTGIFEKNIFCDYIEGKTAEDGADLGMHLAHLFQVLDTPVENRNANLDESLDAFPYINGHLFRESLKVPSFDSEMRRELLRACYFEWSRISPAIFGSLFQSVMDPAERRSFGAHYTSEENILKLIEPLFLDDLRGELDEIKKLKRGRVKRLEEYHAKLASLKFLDPACGCGNFLVVTYRELRSLEMEVIKLLHKDAVLDIGYYCKVNVDQMRGIEIEEFPARIAEVALWLVDHQMNIKLSEEFGMYYARLPLAASAKIHHGDALSIDWDYLLHGSYFDVSADTVNVSMVSEPTPHYDTINISARNLNIVDEAEIRRCRKRREVKFDYILGNPPFVGAKYQNAEQRAAVRKVFANVAGAGVLDFVTCWYIKAAQYIQGTRIKAAFVSTNSITQGEQVAILWNELFNSHKIKIHFAHRTFRWNNEASGKARVHVVIIGFGCFDVSEKWIYDYDKVGGVPHAIRAGNINPYLVDAADAVVAKRQRPLCDVPEMRMGNKPIDGGNYLFSDAEKRDFVAREPLSERFFRRWVGADEFLNGKLRGCLWLGDCPPHILRRMPLCLERVAAVREMRLRSSASSTRKLAKTPTRFHLEFFPEKEYLLIPSVSSERREYIPIGFMPPEVLTSNLCLVVPGAGMYHFGVLQSKMHMVWVRRVCGRLKSDYRYSNKLVYNNFPWPDRPAAAAKARIEEKARKILVVRDMYPESTPADLYDPLTMPSELANAHEELDSAVDAAYRPSSFKTDMERLAFLFDARERYLQSVDRG